MKLFVTDYDNTLYVNDEEIKETIEELKRIRNKDIKVVIATGRPIGSIKNEVLKHGIPFDYLSCADGSLIYDDKYNLIQEYKMENDIVSEIPKLVSNVTYEEMQYSYTTGYEKGLDLSRSISSVNVAIFENCITKELQNKWNNLKEKYPNYSFLTYKHFHTPTRSYIYFLCIKSKGVSKSKSVEFLKNYLNIKEKDIFVIGDSDNDYEMIRDYNGVCVEGAADSIKEISSCIYEKISDYLKEL